MKKSVALFALTVVSTGLLVGCVPMTYTKSVTVQKDANGKITGSTETETLSEAHSETPRISTASPMQYEHLK